MTRNLKYNIAILVLAYFNNILNFDKGKLAEKRGRKATGLNP